MLENLPGLTTPPTPITEGVGVMQGEEGVASFPKATQPPLVACPKLNPSHVSKTSARTHGQPAASSLLEEDCPKETLPQPRLLALTQIKSPKRHLPLC